jgi:hypothetical protein
VDESVPGVEESSPGVDESIPGVDESIAGVEESVPGVVLASVPELAVVVEHPAAPSEVPMPTTTTT